MLSKDIHIPMKSAAYLLALLPLCLAAVELSPEEAQSIPTIDAQKLEEQAPKLDGKIIKIKFNRRYKQTAKTPNGGLTGTIGIDRYRPNAKAGKDFRYGQIDATIPPEGVEWFLRITTEFDAAKTLFAFAKLSTEGDQLRAEILGNKATNTNKHVVIGF